MIIGFHIPHNVLIGYRNKRSTGNVLMMSSQRSIMRHVYRYKHRKQKQKAAQIRRIKYFLTENTPESQPLPPYFYRAKKRN